MIMLFECSLDSIQRSISYVFQALPLRRYPTPPNKSYGAAYMDRYVQPFHQTSLHCPKLWNQERFEPAHRFGSSQPPHLFPTLSPNYETNSNNDHNAPINRPLRIPGHVTPRQNVNSLQEKRSARQNDQYAKNNQKYFHKFLCKSLRDYTR